MKKSLNNYQKEEEIYLSDSDSNDLEISEIQDKNINMSQNNPNNNTNNNSINNIIINPLNFYMGEVYYQQPQYINRKRYNNNNINTSNNSKINTDFNNNNFAPAKLSFSNTEQKKENEEKNEVISIPDDSDNASNNDNNNNNINDNNNNENEKLNEFSSYAYDPNFKNMENEWENISLSIPQKNNNNSDDINNINNINQQSQENNINNNTNNYQNIILNTRSKLSKKKKKKSSSPEININTDSSPKYYPIWMNKLARSTKGLTKLHYEILDYVSTVLIPNKGSEVLLKQTSILLEKEIKKISKYFDILPYGSYVQKLNTVHSDLDFTLIFTEDFNIQNFFSDEDDINIFNSNKKTGESYIGDLLDFLKRRLINSNFTEEKDIDVISGARVPILKCKCKETGIKIDLSLCRIQSVKLAYKIRKIADKEILIRYTTLLLKEILRNKNLNEVYSGGMSSILIFELVCFFFQRYYNEYLVNLNEINNINKNNITSLGHFFFKFLEFYSTVLDYKECKINLKYGGCIIKEKGWKAEGELNVLDVTNDDNNLGQFCYDYDKIKHLFHRMYLFIRNSPINTIQSYLSPFINKKDLSLVATDEE